MGGLVIRAGIVGLSEGNGHPFSFSAIVNGYDPEAFARAGWPVILDYLQRQPAEAFGFPDVRVTHAWTQDDKLTTTLCDACRIETAVSQVDDMLGAVDALIIARDDWRTHAPLAIAFLEHGTPVFIDKPLTLDPHELAAFEPQLAAGRLMSTSGLRYASELDVLRAQPDSLGPLKLVSATVLNGIERYGVHMLDAIAGLGLPGAARMTRLHAPHEAVALTLDDGLPVILNCLGDVGKTFHVGIFGERDHFHADLHDNFTAFRRTLDRFFGMVRTGEPPIPPQEVMRTMRLIAAAKKLAPGEIVELA